MGAVTVLSSLIIKAYYNYFFLAIVNLKSFIFKGSDLKKMNVAFFLTLESLLLFLKKDIYIS